MHVCNHEFQFAVVRTQNIWSKTDISSALHLEFSSGFNTLTVRDTRSQTLEQ